jgi:hypothetical protein
MCELVCLWVFLFELILKGVLENHPLKKKGRGGFLHICAIAYDRQIIAISLKR